ncbi:MAG: hypothetical protein EHM93_09165 [Bacteroidales bacterium]|nr:MAG: hypothetical protein EHM93_09165 [Bacteroidales bacterium]
MIPKSFYYKIGVIVIVLICMNYLYKYTYYEKDIQTHSEVINGVRKVVKDSCEVVYVGESSNTNCREDDIDKRSISAFIGDYYPTLRVGDITKPAAHAEIFYLLLKNIPESSAVKTVIVTLNLRSFDANWIYSSLEPQIQKYAVFLRGYPPLVGRFLLAFKGYDNRSEAELEKMYKHEWKTIELKVPFPLKNKTVKEWDRAMFHEGMKNPDGSKNYKLTELACHYIKTYAFQIDTVKNPRIKDFDNIVMLARERNWNLIFNFMAENTEKAQELIGDELIFLIKQNRDLLVKRYHRNGVLVVDNLECVPNNQYTDTTWTTEHYAERGRKIVARNVADSLKRFYPNHFF